MQQAGRMEIDLFAQDNMRLQELIDTALAAPFTPEESQLEEAIYPSLMAAGSRLSGPKLAFWCASPGARVWQDGHPHL
jgi:hypothetical protein